MPSRPGRQSDTAGVGFLARLAPGALDGVPRVRAALPSRFAPADPLEPSPEQDLPSWPESTAANAPTPDRRTRTGETMPPTRRPTSGTTRLADATLTIDEPAPTPPRSADTAPAGPHQAAGSPDPAPGTPRPLSADIGLHAAPPGPMPQDPAQLSVFRDPIQGPLAAPGRVVPGIAEPSSDRGQSRSFPAPSPSPRRGGPAPDARGPLRESAVALGKAAARHDAPSSAVVHVTIDRIDLAAPQAPAPVPSPRPRPRRESTMSLGEYLRRRGRNRSPTETP